MSIDSFTRRMVSVAFVATLPACSNVHLRLPGPTPGDRDPGRTIDTRTAIVRSGVRNAEVRRVCRGSRPGGWIAIDYVADSTTCGGSTEQRSRYPVALIVSYREARVGETLDVCADERVPRGWTRVRDIADDPRCPSASPSTEPTVMMIRRVR